MMPKNSMQKKRYTNKADQLSYSSSSLSVSPVSPSSSFIAAFLAVFVILAGTILFREIPELFLCDHEPYVLSRRHWWTHRIQSYFLWRIFLTTFSFKERHPSNCWRWTMYQGRFLASSKLLFLMNTPVENLLIQNSTLHRSAVELALTKKKNSHGQN